jgi:hypothetical protein
MLETAACGVGEDEDFEVCTTSIEPRRRSKMIGLLRSTPLLRAGKCPLIRVERPCLFGDPGTDCGMGPTAAFSAWQLYPKATKVQERNVS